MIGNSDSTERSRIVLENIDWEEEKELIDVLTDHGFRREAIHRAGSRSPSSTTSTDELPEHLANSLRDTTLEQFIEERREAGRSTQVHVKGDVTADPPEGRATAMRVADKLQQGDGRIVEYGEDDLGSEPLPPNSVVVLTIDPAEYRDDLWLFAERRLALSRPAMMHVVVHSREMSARGEKLLDARVYAGDGPLKTVRLETNPYYPRETCEIEFGGFVGDA